MPDRRSADAWGRYCGERLHSSVPRRLLALKEAGTAILLVSADLDEIRALADRILVMEGGRIAGALGPEASERELGLLMGGGLAR